jgi:transcription elongation factor Elf1
MMKKFAIADKKRMTVKCGFCGHTAYSRVMMESEGEDLPVSCTRCKRHFIFKK